MGIANGENVRTADMSGILLPNLAAYEKAEYRNPVESCKHIQNRQGLRKPEDFVFGRPKGRGYYQ